MAITHETFNPARAWLLRARGRTVQRVDSTSRTEPMRTEVLRGRDGDAPG